MNTLDCPARDGPLRLFLLGGEGEAAADGDDLWPHMLLEEFLERHVTPLYLEAQNRHPETKKLYRQVATYWQRCWRKRQEPEPGLATITRARLTEFKAWLGQQRGRKPGTKLSAATQRKLLTHLQKLLDLAGPENRRNEAAAELLDKVPRVPKPPREQNEKVDAFTLDEIGQWLWATRGVPAGDRKLYTCGIEPAVWWQAIVLFGYNTGLRIETLLKCTWEMIGADPQFPNWIIIPKSIYKQQLHGHKLYLNIWARQALDSLRSARLKPQASRLIFPWRGWDRTESALNKRRRQQLAHTEIPPPRRFGFHGLRRCLLSWATAQNWILGTMIGGHRAGNVTREFYVRPEEMVALLEEVPQPRPRPCDAQREFLLQLPLWPDAE